MRPIEFIDALRKTDRYIEAIFMQGGCYQFHLLMKKMYPSAKAYISSKDDHIVSEIGGVFYDITGIAKPDTYRKLPFSLLSKVRAWSFHRNNLIALTECDSCGEPFVL